MAKAGNGAREGWEGPLQRPSGLRGSATRLESRQLLSEARWHAFTNFSGECEPRCGVLEVSVPISEKERGRHIKVQS